MAKVTLVFYGTEKSKCEETELKLFHNASNEIYIEIKSGNDFYDIQHICLDKSTAIKLHRELKKQISFIESEVENG